MSIQPERFDGQIENGGIIQVTNISAIESWVANRLEFRYYVYSSNGTKVKDKSFGRWKRKHFKDLKWHDFNDFLFYWNVSNIGNWNVEGWIEEDGGQSASIQYTIPPPPGQPGVGVSVNIPSRQRDDNMGQTIIQFSDPITTVYGISYANIKRKN
jgi:hypothetical protein